jgi:uncharacterized protein YjbI with pentapeptide repeats
MMDIEDLLQRYANGERNFVGVNLSYRYSRDLNGIDLSGINLKEAVLDRIAFEGVNLSKANLSNVTLFKKSFKGANLSEANLSKTGSSGISVLNFNRSR